MAPKVSVLLPVYNVGPYIRETITSILAQTFTDFELIVVDDLSTDNTVEVVQSFTDPRVQLLRNARNLGRAGTDNAGLEAVRGQYLAKMDGDDLCHPERLARQVAFLDQHPEVNMVGSWAQNFGASKYCHHYPEQPADAQVLTLFTLPTANNAVMMHTSLFREQGMTYDASLRQSEDYDFFVRYIRQIRLHNLQEALVYYRIPESVHKKVILHERANVADDVRALLLREWNLRVTEREMRVYNTISMHGRTLGDITLSEVEALLQKMLAHNQHTPLFDQAALRRGLGERWFEVCYTHPQPRLGGWRYYHQSPLAAFWQPSTTKRLRFFIKAAQDWNGPRKVVPTPAA
ncbi:glycosyltransferase family 2 protein [Hymenobacter sp. B81]|uniref:glycosyltransferase family 2 protein n=1 Tax=Hymenobacter sp. B81 TaxID=3344878 RepID=UPI0037DC70B2